MSFVRSAYVFTPTAISNCALWLDGADPAGTGVVPSAGNLATWVDKSTSAINAIAGTAVYPQYNTAFLNNLGVVGLTNAADYFTVANNLNSASLTYVFVMKPTTANTGGNCGLLSTDTPGLYGRSIALNNMVFQLEYYNGFTATSITLNSTTWYIVSVIFNGTSSITISYNGIISTYAGSGTGTNSSGLTIGSYNNTSSYTTYNANFYLAEAIVYTSALSQTQYQQVEGYLAQKWGLTTSLPAGHPGKTTTIYNAQYRKVNIMGTLPYYATFSPIAISNCALWLDAADSSTITKSGSVVTQWNDKSGNGRNTTTIGGSPTYSSNFINLNGTSSYLVGPYVNTTQYLTMFVIATVDFSQGNYAFYYRLLSVGSTAANDYNNAAYASILHYPNSTQIGGYRNSANNYNTVTTNTTFLMCLQYDGTNSINYLNGQSPSSVASTGSFGTTSYSIGRDVGNTDGGGSYTYWPGKVGEVIIFNASLSTTQRQQVESYLAQKWGLTASLPGGHSHFTQQAGALTKVANTIARMVGKPRVTISIPTTIAGIQMWMDGADPAGTGVVPSNGSVLSTWVDKSGKSFSATGVNSPTVVTNAVNSKSAVSYNGSSYSYSTIASGTFSTAMNIFFVYKVNGAVSYPAPMTRGVGNNGSPIDQYNVTRYLGGGSYNGYSSAWSHASATSTTLFTQLIQQSPSTTYNEYVNGSTTASLSVTGFSASDAASYVYIGTRDDKVTMFNGYMCELIIYNAMVGLAAQQKIEGYLAWKWGIQASLPGGHPYASAAP